MAHSSAAQRGEEGCKKVISLNEQSAEGRYLGKDHYPAVFPVETYNPRIDQLKQPIKTP